MARTSAMAWNQGRYVTGTRRIPTEIARPGDCPTDGCGQDTAHAGPTGPHRLGWVLARVHGSTEPARWFCSGRCSAIGIALAELHTDHSTKGERP